MPYLYFEGASYQGARLEALGIRSAGFATPPGDLVYNGFNVFLNGVLPRIADRIFWIILVLVFVWLATEWFRRSSDVVAQKGRKAFVKSSAWIKRQVNEIGLPLSLFAAPTITMGTLVLFLGWLWLMALGQVSGQKDARDSLREARHCVAMAGRGKGCMRILLRSSDGKVSKHVATVLELDKDHVALTTGRDVLVVDASRLIGMVAQPDL